MEPLNWKKPIDGSCFYGVKATNMFRRRVQAVSIPHPIIGYVAPRPDTSDHLSLKQGGKKRLVHQRPTVNRKFLRKLGRFVKKMLPKLLKPLCHDDLFSFEEWLEQTNYPDWRKRELRDCWDKLLDGNVSEHKIWEAKQFAKDEFYLEYKYHRTINARSDYMKCIFGRFAASMEKKVFKNPWFIKKIPRSEWPSYILERCSGREHGHNSDYSSFEASFTMEIMNTVEMQLYDFMLKNVWTKEVNKRFHALSGWNNITAKGFIIRLLARRLSGEMVTSLGNGFSNLMVNWFVLESVGAKNITGVVEGDDGLFMYDGPQPTADDFLKLGFNIKLIPVEHLSDASFCGVVFDPDDCAALADPFKALATCSWLDGSYFGVRQGTRTDLAIVKGLSMLAQYPGCPVLQSVALWLLRVHNYSPKDRDRILSFYLSRRTTTWWEREIWKKLVRTPLCPQPVGAGSRRVIERVYGMKIEEQLMLEKVFDSADGAVNLSGMKFLDKGVFKSHWNRFTRKVALDRKDASWPFHLRPCFPLEGEDRWLHHVPTPSGYMR